jgi:hypothetical protein
MVDPKQVIGPTGTGQADALLLSCIDYRLPGKIARYMEGRGLAANYDHMILAGASLGVTNTLFPHWGQSFRDHLDLAIKLHSIRRVIILDHRECGSYRSMRANSIASRAKFARPTPKSRSKPC